MKKFSTAGPVNPEDHYCVPFSERLNEQELLTLIEDKKYFILHAPRQTGKTSVMANFAKMLNAEGKYTALYVNVEAGQAARSDFVKGVAIVVDCFKEALKNFIPQNAGLLFFDQGFHKQAAPGNELASFLQFWAKNSSKPLALFIDEIDSLVGDTLISVLRQLRAGYINRPQAFPQSVCLIGLRDVRDYRIWSDVEHQIVLGGSAFNIKAESLRLDDFTEKEVNELYVQHTQATGQKFDDDAIKYAFELTQGQPWLVNALAYQACFKDVVDRAKPITKAIIDQAKETLIKRRDTHLDVLVDRLHEQRVRNIIDAIIAGGVTTAQKASTDDLQYVRDLGLIKQQVFEIANPIYQEIIPRELTYTKQEEMIQNIAWYKNSDGSLNTIKLLEAFAEFYREHSINWLKDCDYKESGPHLLLMAFLQRVINGGGQLHREYALARKRADLLIKLGKQKIVIEIKVWQGEQKTLVEGLQQTAEYMDIVGATEGNLVVFDRSEKKSWEEKIYQRQEKVGNKVIEIWGM